MVALHGASVRRVGHCRSAALRLPWNFWSNAGFCNAYHSMTDRGSTNVTEDIGYTSTDVDIEDVRGDSIGDGHVCSTRDMEYVAWGLGQKNWPDS